MPDDALAQAANVSMTAVLEWRKARGLKRTKGWERRREVEVWAVDVFGDGYTPDIQAVNSSRLKAQWDLPEYVLRLALDYDELCRSVFFLHYELGTEPDAIAKAFGLRPRDVEMAIVVQTAHLQQIGHSCAVCGRACDPAYGDTCSTRCRTEKK
jgi:DNA-directed RNA polymerase specialized sigma24 family protein